MRRYLIAIGNSTMTDDGVGPRVAEAVLAEARGAGFETVVVDHDIAAALAYFDGSTEAIVFVDAVRMGAAPGGWACFSPDEVRTRTPPSRATTHEGDLLRMIDLARRLGCPIPPITILGIEPERIEPGLELSPALRARFDEYVQVALRVLNTP